MLWSSAARRGLRCNPGRQTLPANDARKGTPRMRFRSQSDPGTRSTTLETGSPTQTWPHPAHLEGDDFTPNVLVLYTTFRWTGHSCTGVPMGSDIGRYNLDLTVRKDKLALGDAITKALASAGIGGHAWW